MASDDIRGMLLHCTGAATQQGRQAGRQATSRWQLSAGRDCCCCHEGAARGLMPVMPGVDVHQNRMMRAYVTKSLPSQCEDTARRTGQQQALVSTQGRGTPLPLGLRSRPWALETNNTAKLASTRDTPRLPACCAKRTKFELRRGERRCRECKCVHVISCGCTTERTGQRHQHAAAKPENCPDVRYTHLYIYHKGLLGLADTMLSRQAEGPPQQGEQHTFGDPSQPPQQTKAGEPFIKAYKCKVSRLTTLTVMHSPDTCCSRLPGWRRSW